MTKNIDQLTTMVQQVTLQQAQQPPEPPEINDAAMYNGNHKRIKFDGSNIEDDEEVVHRALAAVDALLPDHAISSAIDTSMDVEADESPSSSSSSFYGMHPSPSSSSLSFGSLPPLQGTTSRSTSDVSDESFVEKLLNVFGDEEESTPPTTAGVSYYGNPNNRPRDELMTRLSDALSLLPRDVQEMIVDRLIQAIVSPKQIQESIQVAHALDEVMAAAVASNDENRRPTSVPQSPKYDGGFATDDDVHEEEQEAASPGTASATSPAPSLPLAAATLAALLSHYGKGHHHHHHDHDDEQVAAAAAALKKSKESAQKSLLIPVHG
jgi:hypothetical protein